MRCICCECENIWDVYVGSVYVCVTIWSMIYVMSGVIYMSWVCMSVWLWCNIHVVSVYVCMTFWSNIYVICGVIYTLWVCMSVWRPIFLPYAHTHAYIYVVSVYVCVTNLFSSAWLISWGDASRIYFKSMWRPWVCLCVRECMSSWKMWRECVSFSVRHLDILSSVYVTWMGRSSREGAS